MLRTFIYRCAAYLWPSPYTLFGLFVGFVLRGHFSVVDGVTEIHGARVAWVLQRLPVRAAAITLGHTVLGQTPALLEKTRMHERVHVRQFEAWGPIFGPAYVLCSIICYFRGQHFYRDNPFEIEAYGAEDSAGASKIIRD